MTDFIGSATMAPFGKLTNAELDASALADERRHERKRSSSLPFRTISEIGSMSGSRSWLIKGILARGETSAWVGPPGSLKSALLASVAISVSGGFAWFGRPNKGRAAVCYFALERADLVGRRLQAHIIRDNIDDLPIAIVSTMIDLTKQNTVASIIATIKQVETKFGLPVGLIVFDTYAKLIAGGGGDENSARDTGAVLANLGRIKEALPQAPHVALIGHTGKDEARGARGSNALLGDVDLMVTISGDEIRTATVTKANDAPEGELFSFESEVCSFGLDEDGDEIAVNIVAPTAMSSTASTGKQKGKLSAATQIALRALNEALLEAGTAPPANDHIPAMFKTVSVKTWRKYAYDRGISDSDQERARQQAFKRAYDSLIKAGRIGYWDGQVWAVA